MEVHLCFQRSLLDIGWTILKTQREHMSTCSVLSLFKMYFTSSEHKLKLQPNTSNDLMLILDVDQFRWHALLQSYFEFCCG